MYEKFRSEVLSHLDDLDTETLKRIAKAMDMAAQNYAVNEAETGISVFARERFKQVVGAYLITKKMEGLAQTSLEQMARVLNKFIMQINKPMESIVANDLRAYLYNYQAERRITNRSLDFIRTIICTFFHWSAAEGYIPVDPAANIKPIRYSRAPRKALTQIELERVRRACRTSRETCIVEILYSTGCRVSELCSIRQEQVDWEKCEIVVLGKGGKYRKVFLNAKAVIAAQAYLKERRYDSPYLLCNDRGGGQMGKANIERIFARIEKETGITVSPHIMRHTMATQALTGTGVEVVQKMLGHASIATTMIYAEVDAGSVHAAHIRCVI